MKKTSMKADLVNSDLSEAKDPKKQLGHFLYIESIAMVGHDKDD